MVEKFVGSLLGLAVCDAVGTTVECMPRGSFPEVRDMIGGGKFNLLPGQWTDDTSMALCLAESLIECRGFNPIDQATRYLKWYQEGHLSSTGECFDIGKTVLTALTKFDRTKLPFCGSPNPSAAGNGCIMRLAPVPLVYWKNPQLAMELSGLSAMVTHGSPVAIDACKYYAGIIIGCINGVSKNELLSNKYCPVDKYWDTHSMSPEVYTIACGSYKLKDSSDIKTTGYIIDSMEAALWAFHRSSSFKEGCLLAVNLGGDADTVGAIYGQLAGAYYKNIPQDWCDKCSLSSLIELFAHELYMMSFGTNINLSLPVSEDSDWNSLFPCIPHKHMSEEYQLCKLHCYDMLEKGNWETIIRKSNPCPKQYKCIKEFDSDVETLQERFQKLKKNERNSNIMKDFENRWEKLREKLDLKLKRPKV